MKQKIEKNTVQETLIIPLYSRKIAKEKFPDLINDKISEDIIGKIDYDFSDKKKFFNSTMGLYGALEVAQREFDLECEIKEYLKKREYASVVNLGCGLNDLFSRVNNGKCKGYNLDFEEVIKTREELLKKAENEFNIACDLNDYSWFEKIEKDKGVIFVASGVFYYFKKEQVKNLFVKMSEYFKCGVLAFDSCNKTGLKMLLRLLKTIDMKEVGSYFCISDDLEELKSWSDNFENVSGKSYMNGYRKLKDIRLLYKFLNIFTDKIFNMQIVKIEFK